MHLATFKLDRNWHEKMPDIPLGSICELIGLDYLKDEMHWAVVFKVIGKPVEDKPSINVVYK